MRRTNAPAKRSSSSSRGEQSWRKSLDELTPVRFARLSARSSHWRTRFERTKRNPSAAKSCCGWMAMGKTRRRQSIVAHFNRRLTDEDDCCHEPDVPSPHRLDCPRCRRGNPSDLPPFYGPGAVRVGSTVTDGSSGRRSAAESARGAIAPNPAGVRYPNEL